MLEVKRRRARGLGSSAAEHQGRAVGLSHNAHDYAVDVVRHSEAGECGAAYDKLLAANRNYGAAIHEYKGAGWRDRFPETTERTIKRAEVSFQRNCVRR